MKEKFVCKRCGYESYLSRMIIDALMMDCGASVSPNPIRCPDGELHDFKQERLEK